MATIKLGTAGTAGFRFDKFDNYDFFDYDNATNPTSTGFKTYADSKNYTTATGKGLHYIIEGNEILGIDKGTITGIKQVTNGVTLLETADLNVSGVAFSDALDDETSARGVQLLLSGNDTISGTKYADVIWGGEGNDTLIGGAGADKLYGNAGADTVSYATSAKGVTVNFADVTKNTGDAAGDKYSSIENLTGSKYADKLIGNASANTITGGDGNDILVGGAGADKLYGSGGRDAASYETASKSVTANLADVTKNTGDASGDKYSSIEDLTGSAYADKLSGNSAANIITGGKGADLLHGGGGADTFVFKAFSDSTLSSSGRDTLDDFVSDDRIDLHLLDASTKTSGDQSFDFIGTKTFTGHAGELRYQKHASDTYIYADIDGDKTADFAIHLDDAISLAKGYFIL